MVTKISNTCRMCSKHFVLTWEKHEIQEYHFIGNKRGKNKCQLIPFCGWSCSISWFSFSTRLADCFWEQEAEREGGRAGMRLATKSGDNPKELNIRKKQTLLKETI